MYLNKIKKWNWTLLLLTICVCEIGALGNENISSTPSALLFGLIAGIIFGIPLAVITKEH